MQYYYEKDLYRIDTELTEVAQKVMRLTHTNSPIFHTYNSNSNTTDLLTILDLFNMSNHPDNHAFLHQLISLSSTTSGFLNWEIISQFTTLSSRYT